MALRLSASFSVAAPGLGIDDAGAGIGRENVGDLPPDPVARLYDVADIGSVEAGDDEAVSGNAELGEDVGAGLCIGRRGEGKAGDGRESVEQRA